MDPIATSLSSCSFCFILPSFDSAALLHSSKAISIRIFFFFFVLIVSLWRAFQCKEQQTTLKEQWRETDKNTKAKQLSFIGRRGFARLMLQA